MKRKRDLTNRRGKGGGSGVRNLGCGKDSLVGKPFEGQGEGGGNAPFHRIDQSTTDTCFHRNQQRKAFLQKQLEARGATQSRGP